MNKKSTNNYRKEMEARVQEALAKRDGEVTVEATIAYNESIAKHFDSRLNDFKLPEGKLMIRLFRAAKKLPSGIYMPTTTKYISENTGQLKIDEIDSGDAKYLSRAVIVKVSDDLQGKYFPGTVIDLFMASYKNITQFWSPLNREELLDSTANTENYFTVPESVINFIWENYSFPALPDVKENPSMIIS